MDLQFRQRQRRFYTKVPFFPLSVGNKFTDHFPSVVHGVKFLMKQEPPVCRGWRLVCWKKGSWQLRKAQGSPAFQHTALALASDRREFRVRPDPFQSARSYFALEMHYFALHFLLSLRIFYGTYRVRITLFSFLLYVHFDGQRLMG